MKKVIGVFILVLLVFLGTHNNSKDSEKIVEKNHIPQTYYVATSGSDENLGTLEEPFKNIQKAIDTVKPGGTVLVRQGVYQAFEITNMQASVDFPVVIKPYQTEHVTIDVALGGGNGVHGIAVIDSSFVTIDGFEIKDSLVEQGNLLSLNACNEADLAVIKLPTNQSRGVKVEETKKGEQHNVTFQNLHIHHVARIGVGAYKGRDNKFLHNRVHDVGAYGWYMYGDNFLIEGNETYNTNGYGMHLWPTFNNSVVKNNNISHAGKAPCYYHEASDSVKDNFKDGVIISGEKTIFEHNTVSYNQGAGIRIVDVRDITVRNSEILNNEGVGIIEEAGREHVVIDNSKIVGNKAGDVMLSDEAVQVGNIVGN
ncbi:MAG: hypothetical protein COV34_03435 [Candidatus Zambryskibacteria bacterium CG10_big_fil_rev_8_21_14_0_10_42_12]|uniref:Uncharacterized protein n=1 Tax=Candidatus Zambryskibacteria bacterium CG10_big_fil_rev_8_21_14_0_10_42_12 TaxID=1975115 RepID=A0A2H0QSF9_9BACT|nr:MAG: hypothetical protein COV34_03435 [Candidatus Zambryskibacteria bacterium CG10_big_fil_rev_8_21_14_0_10_42_12]